MLNYFEFYTKRNTLTSSRRLFWYFRTVLLTMHKINLGKPRCSQTQFKALAAWCRVAVCGSWKGSQAWPLLLLRCSCLSKGCCETNAKRSFFFSFLFLKAKVLFRFLSVSKHKYDCRSFTTVKWHNENFSKPGLPICHTQKAIWGQWTVSATLYSSFHTFHLFQWMLHPILFFSNKGGQGVGVGWEM